MNNRRKISNIQQTGCFRNQFFLRNEGTFFAESFADVCFYHGMVIAGTIKPNAVFFVGDGMIYSIQYLGMC